MIILKNIYKSYQHQKVLQDISFTLHEGVQVSIQGASGSGKSTLLYLLGGLESPTYGSIEIGSFHLQKMNSEELARYRNQYVGFVFQFHFLLSSMTALENILLPGRISGSDLRPIMNKTYEYAEHLEVKSCLNKYPHELSGGQQQRVNLLRAISLNPKLLLCDEATGNLDSKNSEKVIHLIKELASLHKSTLLVVTHDEKIAKQFPFQLKIEDGKIIH